MDDLLLTFSENFTITVCCDNSSVIDDLKEYLTTQETKTIYVKLKKGGVKILTKDVKIKLYVENFINSITVKAGLMEYIAVYIPLLLKKYPNQLKLRLENVKLEPLILSDKWKTIFQNHPKPEKGKHQLEDFLTIVKSYCGIAELYTGYGKSELILSLAESHKGRVVVLVPDNNIRDEIMLRAEEWGTDVGNYSWDKSINVINAVGLMKSAALNDDAKNWLNGVEMCIIDECHHASAMSFFDIYNFMPNIKRSYGVSATADVKSGVKFRPGVASLKELGPNGSKIVGICGPIRTQRSLIIPVKLVRIMTTIADSEIMDTSENWIDAYDTTIRSPKLSYILSMLFTKYPDRTFFIPIPKKETGELLYHRLVNLGYTGAFLTSQSYLINGEKIKVKEVLKDIKDRSKNDNLKFIMSTKFEGMNLPSIDCVIPIVGVNHKMTLQSIGRAARNDDVLVILLNDSNNKVILSQNRKRRSIIEAEYNVISNEYLKID